MNPHFNNEIFQQMHWTNEQIRVIINRMNKSTFGLDKVDSVLLGDYELKMKFLCKNYPIEWKAFQQRVKEPPSLS